MKNKKLLLSALVILIITLISIFASSNSVQAATANVNYSKLKEDCEENVGIYTIDGYLNIKPKTTVEPIYLCDSAGWQFGSRKGGAIFCNEHSNHYTSYDPNPTYKPTWYSSTEQKGYFSAEVMYRIETDTNGNATIYGLKSDGSIYSEDAKYAEESDYSYWAALSYASIRSTNNHSTSRDALSVSEHRTGVRVLHDPAQYAIWDFLYDHKLKNHGIPGMLESTNPETDEHMWTTYLNTPALKSAYNEIRSTMEKIYDGEIDFKCDSVTYIWGQVVTSNNGATWTRQGFSNTQHMMEIFASKEPAKEISVKLKKVDSNGELLKGAAFNIAAVGNGIEKICDISVPAYTVNMGKNEEVDTFTIRIKPEFNKGVVKVKATEFQQPAGCIKIDPFTITIKYNDGVVEDVSIDPELDDVTIDDEDISLIYVKNHANPVQIPLKKVDKIGEAIGGIEFSIRAWSGIEKINGESAPSTKSFKFRSETSDDPNTNGYLYNESGDPLEITPSSNSGTMKLLVSEISTSVRFPYTALRPFILDIEYEDGEIISAKVNSLTPTEQVNTERFNNDKHDPITIINYFQPIPLKIVKEDENGNKLGKGFFFQLNFVGNASLVPVDVKVEIDKKYLQEGKYSIPEDTNTYITTTDELYVQTDENGEINLKFYPEDNAMYIDILETDGQGLFKNNIYGSLHMNFGVDIIDEYIDRENAIEITGSNHISDSNIVIHLKNKLKDLSLDITKIDSLTKQPVSGATFNVMLTSKNGTKYIEKTGVTTDANGKLVFDGYNNINLGALENGEKLTLALIETNAAPGYDGPKQGQDSTWITKYINFEYVIDEYGIASYKMLPGDVDASLNKDGDLYKLNVELENTPTTDLLIKKEFHDTEGKDITEEVIGSYNVGDTIEGVKFDLTFNNMTAKINDSEDVVTGKQEDIKLKVIETEGTKYAAIELKNIKLDELNSGSIVIEETESLDGFAPIDGPRTVTITKEGNTWKYKSLPDSGDCTINVYNEVILVNPGNEIDKYVYPLKIEKYGEGVNKLTGECKFDVIIGTAEKVIVEEKYVDEDKYEDGDTISTVMIGGQPYKVLVGKGDNEHTFYLKTNNGEINIYGVIGYLGDIIYIRETYSENPLYDDKAEGAAFIESDAREEDAITLFDGEEYIYTKVKAINTIDDVTADEGSLGIIKVKNKLKPLTIDLFKYSVDNQGNRVGLGGAIFDVTINGKVYEGMKTESDGTFKINGIDATNAVNEEMIIEVKEKVVPPYAIMPERTTHTIKFKFNTETQKFEFTQNDDNVASFDGDKLNLNIENIKLPYLTIEKYFTDENSIDVTKYVKDNSLINGDEVKFTITLDGCNATIDGTECSNRVPKLINLGEHDNQIYIDKIHINSGNTAKIKVKEEETLNGFEKITKEMIFVITVDNNLDWTIKAEPTEGYPNVNIDDKKIQITNTTENPDVINVKAVKKGNDGENLANVQFKVTITKIYSDGTNEIVPEKIYTTDTYGKISIPNIAINPSKTLTKVKAEFKEQEVPEGYMKYGDGTYTIEATYDSSSKAFTGANGESNKTLNSVNYEGNTVQANIINIKKLPSVELYKTDGTKPLTGAEFTVEYEGLSKLQWKNQVRSSGFTAVVDNSGKIVLDNLIPQTFEANSTIKLKFTETKAPTGFDLLKSPIELEYNYKPETGELKLTKGPKNAEEAKVKTVGNAIEVTAIDTLATFDLTLKKEDSLNKPLKDVQFKITFNEGSLNKLTVPSKYVLGVAGGAGETTLNEAQLKDTTFVTDSNGEIKLNGILLNNTEATLQVTESKGPDGEYLTLDKPVKYNIVRNIGTGEVTVTLSNGNTKVRETEKKISDLTTVQTSGNNVAIKVINPIMISIKGQVWWDKQSGDKYVLSADGIFNNNDSFLGGVRVYLYDETSKKVCRETTTGANGEYSFENVDKTDKGYTVYFQYDGVNYQATKYKQGSSADIDSDAQEDGSRAQLNDRLKTITKGQSNDGTKLEYDTSDDRIAVLKTEMDGCNPAIGDSEGLENFAGNFKVNAKTEPIKNTDENVNLGLVRRYFDLSLQNYPDTVTYSINGNTLVRSTGIRNDSDLLENGNGEAYTQEIYKSDYKYRFDDYKNTAVNPGDNIDTTNSDEPTRDTVTGKDSELDIEVTYILSVNKPTNIEVDNAKVKYTFDTSKYDFVSIGTGIEETAEAVKADMADGTAELTVKEFNKDIEIVFKIHRDSDGNLPADIDYENGLDITNQAEIIAYTTKVGGYVDEDSEPGNERVWEDDMYGVTVKFQVTDKVRKISGNVAEANSDGSLSEEKIDDVIVQLVEKLEFNDRYYEYIWQETRTGSNEVKARGKDGHIYKYENEVTGKGQYQFLSSSVNAQDTVYGGGTIGLDTGFIPGKTYVVRFIYGDGRTYDVTADSLKYNGQDYKAAIDNSSKDPENPHYDDKWYNKAVDDDQGTEQYVNNNYKENYSVAWDNEARRLDVMAYSTSINKNTSAELSLLDIQNYESLTTEEQEKVKDVLSKTWMNADTSLMDIEIDDAEYNNVNLGLSLRPQTRIELEKHITALKITTSAGTELVNAKINDDKLANYLTTDESIIVDKDHPENNTITGTAEQLAAMKSSRDERGFWKAELDTRLLGQGAYVEVEYTYVIKNNSDEDYLSGTLVSKYKERLDTYGTYLGTIAGSVNSNTKIKGFNDAIGTYLGQFYYTGVKGAGDALVASRVDGLEENINNNLGLREIQYADENGTKFAYFDGNEPADKKTVYNDQGNPKDTDINTVITLSENASKSFLVKDESDYNNKVWLNTVLSASNPEASYPSYIAEITEFTNAAGRRNMNAVPGNLSYVHSEDDEMTLNAVAATMSDGKTYYLQPNDPKVLDAVEVVPLNEEDEFWGETLTIIGPTGEDRAFPVQTVIIAVSTVSLLAVGIILIKKYVIK